MRRFSPIVSVVIVALLAAPSAAAARSALQLAGSATTPSNPAPTPQQIHQAVAAAKRSRNLWSTVNMCGTAGTTRAFGLRAQMPSLGFSTSMYMTFSVYYRAPSGTNRLVSGTRKTMLVAQGSTRLYQAGVTFHFSPPATLSGRVLFVWKLQGRQLGQAIRWTTPNHHHVDHANPPRYSAAQCTLQ